MTTTGRRSNNEDNFCAASELGLFAVADGLGGYEGGEVASALTVDALRRFIERHRRDPLGTWPCKEDKKRTLAENLLRAATIEAHELISDRRAGVLSQMGSTVATALFHDDHLTLAHVGDSRVYRLRNGTLMPLTTDHSLYAELVASGRELPSRHDFPYKNQITRALGLPGNSAADTSTHLVERADRYLLCTDGLYDPFEDAELAQALLKEDVVTCCTKLVELAYEKGSTDNITCIVVEIGCT